MTEVVVLAFTAFCTVIGGAIAYWNQKRIDRRESLNERRRDVYQRFLEALFDHVEVRNNETRRVYDRLKCELLLLASDRVLKELPDVQEASVMDINALGPEDVHQRVSALFKAMRKDSFEKTKIEGWNFEYLVPIGKPTPVTRLDQD